MSLRVIGAGVGRTGTTSLQAALERLLGGRCYHMVEVLRHPRRHTPIWREAVNGGTPDWNLIYEDYVATVDWPGAAFWRPLSEAYPDALVILSVRSSAAEWYESASQTVEKLMLRRPPPKLKDWHAMVHEMLRRTFTPMPFERGTAEAAYERHNAEVRAGIPPQRLLEWNVKDGWGPICERLGVPVPDEPFPRLNTEEEFVAFLESRPKGRSFLPRALRGRRP